MLKNGTYAAWFKTPLGQGTGIAHVADGKIWGRDSLTTYSGSCELHGDRFTATVSVKRHSEGNTNLFGVDDFEMKVEGICVGKIGEYIATTEQAPGVALQGTLILSEPQPAAIEPSAPTPTFNPDKLAKLPKLSR